MTLVRRREVSGGDLRKQIRRRLREIQRQQDRLETEQATLEARLNDLERVEKVKARDVAPAPSTRPSVAAVACPRCGRDHDFLTDADGYLAHVLEEAEDTDLLDDGKPLFCPACGEVFLYESPE